MTLDHGGLVTSCFVILLAIATIGSASAAPAAKPSITHHRHHGAQMSQRHTLNNYYTGPMLPRPDCYLPSDRCPNEDSVQN
jgi:hypothetical protein